LKKIMEFDPGMLLHFLADARFRFLPSFAGVDLYLFSKARGYGKIQGPAQPFPVPWDEIKTIFGHIRQEETEKVLRTLTENFGYTLDNGIITLPEMILPEVDGGGPTGDFGHDFLLRYTAWVILVGPEQIEANRRLSFVFEEVRNGNVQE